MFQLSIWSHGRPKFGSFGHSLPRRMSAILNVFILIMIETTSSGCFNHDQNKHVSIMIRTTHPSDVNTFKSETYFTRDQTNHVSA